MPSWVDGAPNMAFRKKKNKKTPKVEATLASTEIQEPLQDEDDALTPEIIEASADSEEPPIDESTWDGSDILGPEEITEDSKALAPTDAMSRYMAEVSKYPVLSREEEHKLAVRYKETGDPKAAEALVTANLRFVVKVAAEYTKFGSKLIDLVQEGNVGLMHAVKEFNPYKGVR
ncbi:MAG: RNA polymerase subunit sigma, partial [Bdellovibrionales bacterium]|nr:RNA polymerase subunit sigma [Bdellovibrionales bacterium]